LQHCFDEVLEELTSLVQDEKLRPARSFIIENAFVAHIMLGLIAYFCSRLTCADSFLFSSSVARALAATVENTCEVRRIVTAFRLSLTLQKSEVDAKQSLS
jgi:hypothetical protein